LNTGPEVMADQFLAAKRADAGADTSALEAAIDRHVYARHRPSLKLWPASALTPAEIKIVEEASAKP
jgi:hypothetical protein